MEGGRLMLIFSKGALAFGVACLLALRRIACFIGANGSKKGQWVSRVFETFLKLFFLLLLLGGNREEDMKENVCKKVSISFPTHMLEFVDRDRKRFKMKWGSGQGMNRSEYIQMLIGYEMDRDKKKGDLVMEEPKGDYGKKGKLTDGGDGPPNVNARRPAFYREVVL
jgi:hypothetical protein